MAKCRADDMLRISVGEGERLVIDLSQAGRFPR